MKINYKTVKWKFIPVNLVRIVNYLWLLPRKVSHLLIFSSCWKSCNNMNGVVWLFRKVKVISTELVEIVVYLLLESIMVSLSGLFCCSSIGAFFKVILQLVNSSKKTQAYEIGKYDITIFTNVCHNTEQEVFLNT